MTAEQERNQKLAATVIKNLEERHFEAYYCKTKEEANEKILSFIKYEDVIGWGGSSTMVQLGVMEEIKSGKYKNILNRDIAQGNERLELMQRSLLADVFLSGTNALTEDGQLFNIDANGNRVAALAFGPRTVIVAAGINKIVKTEQDAISRCRNLAAPINAQRFELKTPCKEKGICMNCKSQDSICCSFLQTRLCHPAKRIKVIIIGENLGF